MGRILPVQRILTIESFPHSGEIYFRTREVAGVLGIKQPFEFTSDIKALLGVQAIKKGEDTVDFRSIDDSSRTTFVSARDLKIFLESGNLRHKIIPFQRESLLNILTLYY